MARFSIVWLVRGGLIVFIFVTVLITFHPMGFDLRLEMYKNADKILHVASAFSLSLLLLFAFPRVSAKSIFGLVVFLSFLVEALQMLGPRNADLIDLGTSLIGAALAAIAYFAANLRQILTYKEN